jgi:hypothetical protein
MEFTTLEQAVLSPASFCSNQMDSAIQADPEFDMDWSESPADPSGLGFFHSNAFPDGTTTNSREINEQVVGAIEQVESEQVVIAMEMSLLGHVEPVLSFGERLSLVEKSAFGSTDEIIVEQSSRKRVERCLQTILLPLVVELLSDVVAQKGQAWRDRIDERRHVFALFVKFLPRRKKPRNQSLFCFVQRTVDADAD